MAPRRSKTGKRRPTRPTMRKAKQMIRSEHKRKAKKNMDNFFFKAKTEGVIIPTQGTTVSNYISVWYPLLSATSAVGVTQNPEFILYRNLYDKVRINSIKVTIKPKANVLSQAEAQQDGALNLVGSGVYHSVVDRDDQPPANIIRLTRYPSYKRTSVLKPLTRTYSIKYPTGVWLDCQNIYSDTTLLTRLGLTGGIYMYAESLLEDNLELFNEPFAEALFEYNCVFQGKTSGSLTYDSQTGTVSVGLTPAGQVLPNSTIIPVAGTINDQRYDISGNLVPHRDTDAP